MTKVCSAEAFRVDPGLVKPGASYDALMAQGEFAVYVARVEPDGGFVIEDANETVAKLAGRPASTIIGRATRDYLSTEDADFLDARLRGCVMARRPISFERSWNSDDGRAPWKTTMLPVVEQQGAVTHVVGIASDITIQTHNRNTAEHYRALLEGLSRTLPGILYFFNLKQRTLHFIDPARDDIGTEGRKTSKKAAPKIGAFVHSHHAAEVKVHMAELAALRDGETVEIEYRALHSDGCDHHYSSRLTVFSRDPEGAVELVLGVSTDLTEQDKVQDEVRDLSERLMTTRIDERRRIAEDLHDSTAQHLTAVGLALARISASTGTPGRIRRSEMLAGLEDARSSLDEAHREIRMLSYLLHPPLLESKGLGEAIRIFATGFATRASLGLEIRIDPHADIIPDDAALSLFRVCQEALTNVHRHAKAKFVVVELTVDESLVMLKVEDDGCGFKEARPATEKPVGVGLAGMRERMIRLGGYVQLKRGGIGTRLVATIPTPGQKEGLLL